MLNEYIGYAFGVLDSRRNSWASLYLVGRVADFRLSTAVPIPQRQALQGRFLLHADSSSRLLLFPQRG